MSRGRRRREGGFSLLEVLIAVAILAVSLVILVGAQYTAVRMDQEARELVTATMLARDVMTRVELYLEERGFGETELTESGDFKADYPGEFDAYSWSYGVYPIDLDLGNVQGLLDAFGGGGASEAGEGEGTGTQTEQVGAPQDLGDLGIDLGMFDDQIARYIRAIEVTVSWQASGAVEPEELTLVTHVVNPSGRVASEEEEIGGLPSLSGGTVTATPTTGGSGGGSEK